jgi:hypothetical protein
MRSDVGSERVKSFKETKENSLGELHSIPKEAFQECFQNWKKY